MNEVWEREFRAELARDARLFCDRWLPEIRDEAWQCGYAVGLHGTVARDIDLIAVPWIDNATSAEVLMNRIASRVGTCEWSKKAPTIKPHGRLAWSMHFPENPHVYLDLSVMPRLQ
jgi:hypothetical protein